MVSCFVGRLVKFVIVIRHTHILVANTAVIDQPPMFDFQRDLSKSLRNLFIEQTVVI